MTSVLQDVRYALRSLARTRRVTLTAVLTLALGIGTNVAIFSVVNGVLLKPLDFAGADRLVRITADFAKSGATDIGISQPEIADYRARAGVFEAVAGVYPVNANLTGVDEPERIEGVLSSANFFTLLGVEAQLGRVFTEADETPGNADLVVISDELWARRFGRDPGVIGRRIRLDDDPYTIIGVLPAGFHHPGRGIVGEPEFFSPSSYVGAPYASAPTHGIHVLPGAIARLKPGVSIETAAATLDALGTTIRAEHPADYPESLAWRPRVLPLQEDLVGRIRPALLVLAGAVGAVLLIACANVANLLLVRASTRTREFAVRAALGATRARLLRQLLAEGLVLALAGGAAGLVVARWLISALVALAPQGLPQTTAVGIDARTLLFSIALSIVTGMVFGVWPALHSSPTAVEALKESTRSLTAARPRTRTRGLLVATEFALALVLLVTAALFVRSFLRVYAVDSGFSSDHVLTARLWMPLPNDPTKGAYSTHALRLAFFQPATDRISALPGVLAAGWVSALPLGDTRSSSFFLIEGQPPDTAARNAVELLQASPAYFRALGIGLVRGRLCTDQDTAATTGVALVSESLVRRYFPALDPVGTRIRPGGPFSTAPWLTIIGVVRDVRSRALDTSPPPQLYRCLWQSSNPAMTLVVRTAGDPGLLERPVRAAVRAVDPDLPLYSVQPMDSVLASSLAQRRFAMIVVAAFAVLALGLSAVGVYSVLAYMVEQRTREIGVRVALGASRSDILRLVLGTGLGLAAGGAAVGLAGAALVARTVSSMLFDVSPLDPVSFAGIPAVLLTVALVACILPARRAAHVDPLIALRTE